LHHLLLAGFTGALEKLDVLASVIVLEDEIFEYSLL